MPSPGSELSSVHRTAIAAAGIRASHLLRGSKPTIFADDFALALSELSEEQALGFATMSERLNGANGTTSWVLRSRFTEDRLADALSRVAQYVILGAGLDSYALRMRDRLGKLQIFEVDDPPFQDWKLRRLEALGLNLPPQVHFVPCDFERTSLVEALAKAGFRNDQPCFVSWLGVTQYLSREAIMETLRWAGCRPAGSEIVLTFVVPGAHAERIRQASAQIGLDFSTFLLPEDVTGMLQSAGFTRIDHLTPARANVLYFAGRPDGLSAPEQELLVSAIV